MILLPFMDERLLWVLHFRSADSPSRGCLIAASRWRPRLEPAGNGNAGFSSSRNLSVPAQELGEDSLQGLAKILRHDRQKLPGIRQANWSRSQQPIGTNVTILRCDPDLAVSERAARHSPDHLMTSPRGTDEPRHPQRHRFLPRPPQDDLALVRRREVAVPRIEAAFVLFSTRPDASTSDRTENRAGQAGTATRRSTSIGSLRVVAARFRSRRAPHTTRPKQLGSQNWRNELRPVAAVRELHHIGRALEKLLRVPPQRWSGQSREPARYRDHPTQHESDETAHASGRAQGRIRRSRFRERTG